MTKNKTPLVSICIATYNGEKYLEDQLTSIFNQSYTKLEIIVQDDCSSDETLKILHKYQEKITIYKNKENLGYRKNFESLIKKADGEYIALCDQDDLWEENKIEILLQNIGDNTLIYSNSLLIDHNAKSLDRRFSDVLKFNFISSKTPLNFFYNNSVSAHALMFKKELLASLFPFPIHIFFDAWIAIIAASLNGVTYIDMDLVHYRQHTTNTLSDFAKSKKNTEDKRTSLHQKMHSLATHIHKIKTFLKINTLKEEDKKMLLHLLRGYNRLKSSYFSIELFLFLYQNKNIFFAITRKNKFRLALKRAIGYTFKIKG
jgi:glycosyltransferase involved in cell wall biosynthesis